MTSHSLQPAGMESLDIRNDQLSVSSMYTPDYGPENARLNKPSSNGKTGAWSALTSDVNQWIGVDLRSTKLVTGVATQGREDHPQWVTKFVISYSTDNRLWYYYPKDLHGNFDKNTVMINKLEPFQARYVRIHPKEWKEHISLRFEIYVNA